MRAEFQLACAILVLASNALLAGTAAADLRRMAASAAQSDSPASVTALCGFLTQAVTAAAAAGKNIDLQREYEDIQWDIQKALSQQQSDASRAVLVRGLPGLAQPAQVTALLALKDQPASVEIGKAVLQLLRSTQNIQVQVAALDLLGEHRVADAVPEAVKFLNTSKLVMVQIAACRALARIPSTVGIPPLIEYLAKLKGGRLRHEAVAALRSLSGQKFSVDAGTWRDWWSRNQATHQVSPTPEPPFNYELSESGSDEPQYYEIPVVENRVVFVVDTSGSMQLGGTPNRWQRSRDELKRLIARLNPNVHFNIVTYNTKVTVWQEYPPLVPATPGAVKLAQAFLDKADPGGGTETTGALEMALRTIGLMQGVETVYLLSDGAPNPLRFSGITRMEDYPRGIVDIQERIRLINQSLKIRIHTIGVYTKGPNDAELLRGAKEPDPEIMKAFLEKLATENDGVYREVK